MSEKFNQTKYINEWKKRHETSITLRLNNNTDADVLKWLSEQKSKQGAIKELIREKIKSEQRD